MADEVKDADLEARLKALVEENVEKACKVEDVGDGPGLLGHLQALPDEVAKVKAAVESGDYLDAMSHVGLAIHHGAEVAKEFEGQFLRGRRMVGSGAGLFGGALNECHNGITLSADRDVSDSQLMRLFAEVEPKLKEVADPTKPPAEGTIQYVLLALEVLALLIKRRRERQR
jgi:hypothetical protein